MHDRLHTGKVACKDLAVYASSLQIIILTLRSSLS